MTLVRPQDIGSVIPAINAIINQLEAQARGEQPIVTDPKVLGKWIEQSGVTLGKLATSYSDAPPGYSVALGSTGNNVSIPAINNTENTSINLINASAFTADGARPVIVSFFAHSARNAGVTGQSIVFVLFDSGNAVGELTQLDLPSSGLFSGAGPIMASTRYLPSAASHTLSVRAYNKGSAGTSVVGGLGGPGTPLPIILRVDVY